MRDKILKVFNISEDDIIFFKPVISDDELYIDDPYTVYDNEDGMMTLDGIYTLDQLKILVEFMEKQEVR